MKRNILYIILAVIIILCLFGLAATCSLCGIKYDTEATGESVTKTDSQTDTVSVTDAIANETNTSQSEIEASDEILEENPDENSEKEAPSIKLEISEGPFYSEADDICYWRVKAIVTGVPLPKIIWSADYSNGSFGKNIVQINLTRDDPEYVLTATATNSEGTASDEIILSWGCDGAEPGDSEDTEESLPHAELIERHDIVLNADFGLSGNIRQGQAFYTEGLFSTGDSNNNRQIKSFLSFNLTGGSGVNVLNARLDLTVHDILGDPRTISSRLIILACDYGNSLDLADFDAAGTNIHTFDITDTVEDDILSINGNDALISTLQEALDENRTWYQMQTRLGGTTNNNGTGDLISFSIEKISLIITYSS